MRKTTGSLYLHCDPTASHYLKVALDGVFGKENFRNEIIWKKAGRGETNIAAVRFGVSHDILLLYGNLMKRFLRVNIAKAILTILHQNLLMLTRVGAGTASTT